MIEKSTDFPVEFWIYLLNQIHNYSDSHKTELKQWYGKFAFLSTNKIFLKVILILKINLFTCKTREEK